MTAECNQGFCFFGEVPECPGFCRAPEYYCCTTGRAWGSRDCFVGGSAVFTVWSNGLLKETWVYRRRKQRESAGPPFAGGSGCSLGLPVWQACNLAHAFKVKPTEDGGWSHVLERAARSRDDVRMAGANQPSTLDEIGERISFFPSVHPC